MVVIFVRMDMVVCACACVDYPSTDGWITQAHGSHSQASTHNVPIDDEHGEYMCKCVCFCVDWIRTLGNIR